MFAVLGVCGKKYKQQISYAKHVSQCELQEDDIVTSEAHQKLADGNSTSTSKLANGRFFR